MAYSVPPAHTLPTRSKRDQTFKCIVVGAQPASDGKLQTALKEIISLQDQSARPKECALFNNNRCSPMNRSIVTNGPRHVSSLCVVDSTDAMRGRDTCTDIQLACRRQGRTL